MSRERKGTIEFFKPRNATNGYWRARITLCDGKRSPWIDFDGPNDPKSDSTAFEEWAEQEARRYTEDARKRGLTLADFGLLRGAPVGETCDDYFKRWVAARKEAGIGTTSDDEGRWNRWLVSHLGTKPIALVTPRQLEEIVSSLDRDVRAERLSWKTAIHVWGLVTKMFDDAHRSKDLMLRARTDNPAKNVRGPDRGAERAGAFLFPTELIALVSDERTKLSRRRLWVFLVYTGLRAGEVRALDWNDVHEDEGFIFVHRAHDRATGDVKSTKTKTARKVPIEPALVPMLEAMREEKTTARVFPSMSARNTLPRALRRELHEAGVRRIELHDDTATTRKLDVHDLRHTYGTWRAIRGDDVIKIRFAMGHTDLQTTQRYINEAHVFDRARFGVPFGPLPDALCGGSKIGSSIPDSSANRQREGKRDPEVIEDTDETMVEAPGIEAEQKARFKRKTAPASIVAKRNRTTRAAMRRPLKRYAPSWTPRSLLSDGTQSPQSALASVRPRALRARAEARRFAGVARKAE